MLHYPSKPQCGNISPDGSSTAETAKSELVVVLHGILQSSRRIDGLVEAITEHCPQADVWVPLLPYHSVLAVIRPETLVDRLHEDLDRIWRKGAYRSLRIVGHSLGGLFGRALMLSGRDALRQRAEEGRPWTEGGGWYWADTDQDSDRLVLLAAINRGVGITRHMGPLKVLVTALGFGLAGLMRFFFLQSTLMGAARGARFLTRMRLRWLEEDHRFPLPLAVQLLGSVDDLVSPDDKIDSVTGANFRYIDVDSTGHMSIIDMGEKAKLRDGEELTDEQKHRREVLGHALTYSPAQLEAEEIRPWQLASAEPADLERWNQVKHVVFVVHGIRDEGHWTDKIARRVWKRAGRPQDGSLEKVVDSYGYFGMGPFLLPWVRWKKVAWLLERYLEARAKYPTAKLSYIGHSHGTYVLAKALETYKECCFHNVVFAGSVVRENYNWEKLIPHQVHQVVNVVATSDWAVAFFPRLFDLYNLQDLGGAGHNGFSQAKEDGPVFTVRYAIGAHGAGIEEGVWNAIADFVLDGGPPRFPEVRLERKRLRHLGSLFIWLLSWVNILLWAAMVTVVLVVVPLLLVKAWPATAALLAGFGGWAKSTSGLAVLGSVALIAYVRLAFWLKGPTGRRTGGGAAWAFLQPSWPAPG